MVKCVAAKQEMKRLLLAFVLPPTYECVNLMFYCFLGFTTMLLSRI